MHVGDHAADVARRVPHDGDRDTVALARGVEHRCDDHAIILRAADTAGASVTSRAGLGLSVKIGGCEAIKDMFESNALEFAKVTRLN